MANRKHFLGYLDVFRGEALNYLSPPRCVICGLGNLWVCRSCNLDFGEPPGLSCPGCKTRDQKFSQHGFACPDCLELESPLDQLIHSFAYERNTFHRALARLKEDGNLAVAPFLSRRFLEICLANLFLKDEARRSLIVPVPATSKKLRLRGFNQAAIFARHLAQKIGVTLREDLLRRRDSHSAQKDLDRLARRKQLKDTYYVTLGPKTLRGKEIILVDDVATTLATLETCATILKNNGADKVRGCVLSWAN